MLVVEVSLLDKTSVCLTQNVLLKHTHEFEYTNIFTQPTGHVIHWDASPKLCSVWDLPQVELSMGGSHLPQGSIAPSPGQYHVVKHLSHEVWSE